MLWRVAGASGTPPDPPRPTRGSYLPRAAWSSLLLVGLGAQARLRGRCHRRSGGRDSAAEVCATGVCFRYTLRVLSVDIVQCIILTPTPHRSTAARSKGLAFVAHGSGPGRRRRRSGGRDSATQVSVVGVCFRHASLMSSVGTVQCIILTPTPHRSTAARSKGLTFVAHGSGAAGAGGLADAIAPHR